MKGRKSKIVSYVCDVVVGLQTADPGTACEDAGSPGMTVFGRGAGCGGGVGGADAVGRADDA